MDGNKLEFKGEEALLELERLTMNAREVQERTLMEILSRNGETKYLQKYIKGISKDICEFKSRVPIVTYELVQPYIERISNGQDSSILSGHRITELLRSSGTSGGEPRLMPSIAEDLDRRTFLYNLLMPIMNRHIAGLDEGKAMNLLFIKAETLTPCGIPARSVLTSYYKSHHFLNRQLDPFNDLTSPNEFILCSDNHQSMYCQLLSGLIHRNCVLRLGAVFASAFLRSITFLERHWQELVEDIRLGRINPKITDHACRIAMSGILTYPDPTLADEIESLCNSGSWRGILSRLWPKTKYIEAVLTGTMAQYIPMLEFYSGGSIPLVCTMYASSECYFGVNLEPLCRPSDVSYTLLPNMAYFEFIELEDGLRYGDDGEKNVEKEKVVDLVDVKVGRYYEIVVTTFAGLYRYRVGDVLQVTGFHNKAPQFKFICRRNVILSIDTDKTNEEDLHKSITVAKMSLEKQNYILIEYTSYADTSTIPGHYVLFWEIKYMSEKKEESINKELIERCCFEVEESLDYVYRRCRSHDRSVGPLEIRMVESGAFEALMDLLISQGSSINQYKTPRCVHSGPALDLLNSKIMACFFSPKYPTWTP